MSTFQGSVENRINDVSKLMNIRSQELSTNISYVKDSINKVNIYLYDDLKNKIDKIVQEQSKLKKFFIENFQLSNIEERKLFNSKIEDFFFGQEQLAQLVVKNSGQELSIKMDLFLEGQKELIKIIEESKNSNLNEVSYQLLKNKVDEIFSKQESLYQLIMKNQDDNILSKIKYIIDIQDKLNSNISDLYDNHTGDCKNQHFIFADKLEAILSELKNQNNIRGSTDEKLGTYISILCNTIKNYSPQSNQLDNKYIRSKLDESITLQTELTKLISNINFNVEELINKDKNFQKGHFAKNECKIDEKSFEELNVILNSLVQRIDNKSWQNNQKINDLLVRIDLLQDREISSENIASVLKLQDSVLPENDSFRKLTDNTHSLIKNQAQLNIVDRDKKSNLSEEDKEYITNQLVIRDSMLSRSNSLLANLNAEIQLLSNDIKEGYVLKNNINEIVNKYVQTETSLEKIENYVIESNISLSETFNDISYIKKQVSNLNDNIHVLERSIDELKIFSKGKRPIFFNKNSILEKENNKINIINNDFMESDKPSIYQYKCNGNKSIAIGMISRNGDEYLIDFLRIDLHQEIYPFIVFYQIVS